MIICVSDPIHVLYDPKNWTPVKFTEVLLGSFLCVMIANR